MGEKLNISPGELRASAHAADTITKDLGRPLSKALEDIAAAADSLRHWSVGPQLKATGEGWGSALGKLRGRVGEHADGLRMVAAGHDVNEENVLNRFKGW
ncbi:hypothetical protein [Streptomyces sp. URMC 125]|uniref:hypothetical protein n=1 Tax=Streptomyces sp. URMC 125 TaxID=3423419 RepID=UPI003F1CB9A4